MTTILRVNYIDDEPEVQLSATQQRQCAAALAILRKVERISGTATDEKSVANDAGDLLVTWTNFEIEAEKPADKETSSKE